ncbi:type II secretion system F family protein [Arthrobacter roseus]|uniref:type II secretion system F family protein n=1 Tax=Arthrobacter roseus TaxID=136274 RepID=UPI00196313AD|nr:type II secretion system F family protein [Arthrobacter roseus]MBM7849297.1 tight adherence protein B [Arthrobacter roseus]
MDLFVGFLLIVAAVIIVLGVAFKPHSASIPLDRRRPFEQESGSHLSRFVGSAADVLDRYFARRNFSLYNNAAIEAAGMRLSQGDYFLLVGAGAAIGGLMGLIAGGIPLALLLIVVAPIIGQLILTQRAASHRRKFSEQLPDTLQLLTGSLRAGHSILRAIDAAATESPSPTSLEMRRVVSATSLGRDLTSSLNNTATRMQNEDFVWIAQAIQINREVGGNLAEVLDQVNDTIRERSEIKGQIKALAAEGKFSAYILVALPFGIIAMLMVVSPGYMDPLFTTLLGWVLIAVSVILMTIGCLWLRKIIDLKF